MFPAGPSYLCSLSCLPSPLCSNAVLAALSWASVRYKSFAGAGAGCVQVHRGQRAEIAASCSTGAAFCWCKGWRGKAGWEGKLQRGWGLTQVCAALHYPQVESTVLLEGPKLALLAQLPRHAASLGCLGSARKQKWVSLSDPSVLKKGKVIPAGTLLPQRPDSHSSCCAPR